MNKISVFTKFLILIIFLANISCSTDNKKKEVYIDRSVDEIYNSAMNFIDNNKYRQSIS